MKEVGEKGGWEGGMEGRGEEKVEWGQHLAAEYTKEFVNFKPR